MHSFEIRLTAKKTNEPFLTTVQAIYAILRDAVFSGELTSDIKLTQSDLAKQFNVSRTPVRDALLLLIEEGYIEQLTRQDYRVKVPSAKDYNEFIAFRMQLETFAVKRAAVRSQPKDLQALRNNIEKFSVAENNMDFKRALELDDEFHYLVVMAAHNSYLDQAYSSICAVRAQYLRRTLAELQNLKSICRAHSKIYSALAERNESAAVNALEEHLKIALQLAINKYD